MSVPIKDAQRKFEAQRKQFVQLLEMQLKEESEQAAPPSYEDSQNPPSYEEATALQISVDDTKMLGPKERAELLHDARQREIKVLKASKDSKESKEVNEKVELSETSLPATIMNAHGSKMTINPGERYTHRGNLIVSCIPDKANVTIEGGNVEIFGDVGKGAILNIVAASTKVFERGVANIKGNSTLVITGGEGSDNINIGRGARVTADGSSSVIIGGTIRGGLSFFNGKNPIVTLSSSPTPVYNVIIDGRVQEQATIINKKGKIIAKDVEERVNLRAAQGIKAAHVKKNVLAKTDSGNIEVASAMSPEKLEAPGGKVLINEKRFKQRVDRSRSPSRRS